MRHLLPLLLLALLATPTTTEAQEALRIVVLKKDRTLLLQRGETVEKRYPIGLGFQPTGDKTQEGDGATPEGVFSVCVKNPQSRYYLSLGLDYPRKDDADSALREGRISQAEHRQVVRAIEAGRCPPWNTRLGGEIFIHGRGAGADWTLGCIALEDDAMRHLFETVPLGTEVEIRP
jgi:murein L,D-transpeptidase YafK